MNSVFGRDGCIAMRCTQWPTSAFGSGMYCDFKPAVDRLPGLAAVVGAERAGRGDGDVDALGLFGSSRIVCRPMPPAPGCPLRARFVAAQAGELVPRSCRRRSCENRRVLDAGISRVRIVQRRLEVPDALELPRVLRAVVPLVRGQRPAAFRRVVDELVALALRHAVGRRPSSSPGAVPGWSQVLPPSSER